jgi:formylglycine-generating enzyme required for sulfatase activity
MSAALIDWRKKLTRRGKAPAAWLAELTAHLDPLLRGDSIDPKDRSELAKWLLKSPFFGKTDSEGYLDCKALAQWEEGVRKDLDKTSDKLDRAPSSELPTLLREFAQYLKLTGIDALGASLNQDAERIRWLKDLTAQGCQVYRQEREMGITAPQDWVPRLVSWGGDGWPSAPGVTLPIFFVTRDAEGKEQGVNGWLRLWLWPCKGAQLELLPSVPQRVQPLARSWVQGLEEASDWMRQKMQGQGGAWRDQALVWEVHTNEAAYDLLTGASASAAFALAGLWLARHSAPAPWVSLLCSMRHDDWEQTRITACIRANTPGQAQGQDLVPVQGVAVKDRASWVLGQGSAERQPVLHVAKGQTVDLLVPGQAKPQIVHHESAFKLLSTLAREALDLGELLAPLKGALDPHLHAFAPEPHQSESTLDGGQSPRPWHLPLLEVPWQAPLAGGVWRALVDSAAQDRRPPRTLEAFALQRWALLAQEQHEGGSVNCLFVNLSVHEENAPQQGRLGKGPSYSLENLLASYEADAGNPLRQVQALQIVGAPGSGKTWLLQRFEQACAERLLWHLDRLANLPERDEAGEVQQDPYPYLDVPLYVSLSALPVEIKKADAVVRWFRTQVLGSADAPDSRLKRRLLNPQSEPRVRLRIVLDGLNELKVGAKQKREDRAREVLRALGEALQPGLPMLLGTRTHHQYTLDHTSANGRLFKVEAALLNAWEPSQIEGYLRKRWAGPKQAHLLAKVGDLMEQIRREEPKGQRLREVLSLPLYLRIQCELLEAGAKALLDSRARLMAALLWRNVHREFLTKNESGSGREDTDLLTVQERQIAQEFHNNPDQEPPAFPREGRLLQGLFALAWQMWLANPDEPVASRGKVALALGPKKAPPVSQVQEASISVRGCLRGLGWPMRSQEKWIEQWINMAKELGWFTVDEKSQTARFAHQAYGEFMASQQLFWKPRHANWDRHPLPENWSPDELAELARQLAPPAPARSCLAELDAQHRELEALWKKVPMSVFERWWEDGIALPSELVRERMSASGWSEGVFQRELGFMQDEKWGVLTVQAGDWVWSLQRYGGIIAERGVFARCQPGPWHQQPLAWALMARYSELWRPYREQMQKDLRQALSDDETRELFSEVGHLPEAPAGALDEIVLLALEALSEPLPWLQALLQAARQTTPLFKPMRQKTATEARQTGCWALLSRALVQEEPKLDSYYGAAAPELVAWRRDVACLLLAVNQAGDPELTMNPAQGDGLRAHDLRHRLQAGLCLSRQGPPGSDAGDHLRFERVMVNRHRNPNAIEVKEAIEVPAARLRREHWCAVHPKSGSALAPFYNAPAPFFMARFPVTTGEFRAFVDAGGYQDADQDWWLQGLAPERSGARAWLLEQLGTTRSAEQGPGGWDDTRWRNSLQPMLNITWYEAAAYARWASAELYDDWLASLAKGLRVPALQLRLPTEIEWEAALHGVENSWPGHRGGGDPSPLQFNHQATGWDRTSPVGSFPASRAPSGLLDALGNQWEWCANDPIGDWDEICVSSLESRSQLRALRGGGFSDSAQCCRVSSRTGRAPGYIGNVFGFRLVLAVVL